jgi:hypothetical protein
MDGAEGAVHTVATALVPEVEHGAGGAVRVALPSPPPLPLPLHTCTRTRTLVRDCGRRRRRCARRESSLLSRLRRLSPSPPLLPPRARLVSYTSLSTRGLARLLSVRDQALPVTVGVVDSLAQQTEWARSA